MDDISAISSLANTNETEDLVFNYMQTICDKYQEIKEKLTTSLRKVRSLEIENAMLKIANAKLQPTITSEKSPKRRKTQSLPSKPKKTDASFANESHSDEFNMAIQNDVEASDEDEDGAAENDVSTVNYTDNDDEEISATPFMQQSHFNGKRDRTKHGSNVKCVPETVPPEDCSPGVICESPLRDRNARPNQTSKRSQLSVRQLKFTNNKPGEDSINEKSRLRKVLSLSTKRLRQSIIDFPPDKWAPKPKSKSDPDETFYDSQNRSKRCSILLKHQRSNGQAIPPDNLFNFSGADSTSTKNAARIKLEPATQLKAANCSTNLAIRATRSLDISNDTSSVVALPSQTVQIVELDDTENVPDPVPAIDLKTEHSVVIRTEYRQPITLQTIKQKAAQPGFMCPDCAPWFKVMGDRLSDRDIQKRLDACSRHRRDMFERPSTPEGFWMPYFEDTQPTADAPKLIDYRLRNRQQVLEESMKYELN